MSISSKLILISELELLKLLREFIDLDFYEIFFPDSSWINCDVPFEALDSRLESLEPFEE